MITRRNLIWLIPLFLALTIPLWRPPVAAFLSPRGGYDASLANRKLDEHNFKLETVHITQSENGKITLEIKAERAYTGKNSNEIEMEEVDAVITSTANEQTFVTSRKGILDKKDSILTLIDEVTVIKPKDKFELYTDLLIYNDKTQIANSPGKTQILGEKIQITGNNLIFNSINQSYDLSGRVYCKLANFSAPDDTAP
jgi:LPS export ABC transporter protein LptC